MPIVIKVSNEQSVRRIRQIGNKFSLQAERWLGSPKGEGKERDEDDGENQKALSHFSLTFAFQKVVSLCHHFSASKIARSDCLATV